MHNTRISRTLKKSDREKVRAWQVRGRATKIKRFKVGICFNLLLVAHANEFQSSME